MTPTITPLAAFYLLGAVQGTFLAALLAGHGVRPSYTPARYLAAFVGVFSLNLADEFAFRAHYFEFVPELIGLTWPTDLLLGPLLYLYVAGLTGTPARGRRTWHFAPFLLAACAWFPIGTLPTTARLALLYGPTDAFPPWAGIAEDGLRLVTVIQAGTYLLYIGLILRRHAIEVRAQFSALGGVELAWLRRLTLACLGLWVAFALGETLAPLFHLAEVFDHVVNGMSVIAIYSMGYLGLRQPAIFADPRHGRLPSELHVTDSSAATPLDEYARSGLSLRQADDLAAVIENLMEVEHLYLEPGLTLQQLAERAGASPNHISQVINERFGRSFFEFVNAYRVEHAQQLLSTGNRPPKVLAVALDSGFSSKSAFYSAFRRHTGTTPTAFRQQALALDIGRDIDPPTTAPRTGACDADK